MSDSTESAGDDGRRRPGRALAIGLVLALAAGGAGFYLAWSGRLAAPGEAWGKGAEAAGGQEVSVAFVAVDPVDVAFGPPAGNRRFRFTCALEVLEGDAGGVALLMPRVRDVLNSYLNALTPEDVEDPAAIMRIRAQLLRRIQIVTGANRVRDLLVTEFILT